MTYKNFQNFKINIWIQKFKKFKNFMTYKNFEISKFHDLQKFQNFKIS